LSIVGKTAFCPQRILTIIYLLLFNLALSEEIVIRNMTLKDLEVVNDWAAGEGWNPGIHDARCYYEADPDGYFVLELDGESIASISAVSYGEEYGFIGWYIVKRKYRGKGYGYQIWQKAMQYLNGRNIGLDGVVGQQKNYARSGFNLAHRNIRFELTAFKKFISTQKTAQIQAISDIPFEQLLEYDEGFFPVRRRGFLRNWIDQPEGKALCWFEGEKIGGYGVIRKCKKGYKIGPLYAETPLIADLLFRELIRGATEGSIYLDVPETNTKGLALARKYNMNKCFETARMYTGDSWDIRIQKVFGITSFEIG